MSSVRTYAVRISNVAYGRNNESRKVIITFGEEIEERLKRNKIDYIYAEPYFGVIEGKEEGYIKFYGFNSAIENEPFMNSKFWAKYDERTHSVRYASKAIVRMFDSFLGEYDNFWDNKLTVGDKMKYEMFHINLKERFGYTIVSYRRGSTMSIVPSERRVKLDYDEKTEERIKEVESISEQQEKLAKDLAAVIKDEQKEAYEDILKRKKEEQKNAFLEHYTLDLDANVKDEFVPATDEAYRREFFADWATAFELFPHEKTVQKDIEGIMGCLEKEMDDYRDRLTKLAKRYEKLNWVYVALTGHLYGDDTPKELYTISAETPTSGGEDGETKEPVPNYVPV